MDAVDHMLGFKYCFLYKTEQMKYSYTPKMYCVLQDELNTIPEERAYEWLVHRKINWKSIYNQHNI